MLGDPRVLMATRPEARSHVAKNPLSYKHMRDPKIINPADVRNRYYHGLGLALLALNKIRHATQGYTRPREFSVKNIGKATAYDFKIAEEWLAALREYAGPTASFENKTILELGPGADLGIGLILLMMGAQQYNAVDVNNLVSDAPGALYEALFTRMEKHPERRVLITTLREELTRTLQKKPARLNYRCDPKFNLSIFKKQEIDLIVSQAAFEHFDDVAKTITQLSKIAKKDTLFIVNIDLQTHTRFIRERDPLNIYRYGDTTYNLFKFRGSPNRMRPETYRALLKANGWGDIEISPNVRLNETYLEKIRPSLAGQFRKESETLGFLDMRICARKLKD